jgi:hypothetical protein
MLTFPTALLPSASFRCTTAFWKLSSRNTPFSSTTMNSPSLPAQISQDQEEHEGRRVCRLSWTGSPVMVLLLPRPKGLQARECSGRHCTALLCARALRKDVVLEWGGAVVSVHYVAWRAMHLSHPLSKLL